jgi:hypothetical protein
MRWASPSTPLSWRITSWMDLMTLERLDMLFLGFMNENGR